MKAQQNKLKAETEAQQKVIEAEAAANAAGGKVIESRSLAVDPTTLSKRELREYNRINRRGDKEITRQQKKSKRRLKVWQRVLIALLALILLAVAVAGMGGLIVLIAKKRRKDEEEA